MERWKIQAMLDIIKDKLPRYIAAIKAENKDEAAESADELAAMLWASFDSEDFIKALK